MVKRIYCHCLAALSVGVLCGCTTVTIPPEPAGTRYTGPTEIVPGNPRTLTVYDLDSSIQALIQKMKTHPQFARNYRQAKVAKGKGRLPVVCLGLLENKTTDGEVRSRLRAADDTLRASLFDTGLFEVKDDEAADAIKSRIIRGADGGLENANEIIASFGEHEAPDFIVLGDLRHFEDVGGYHTYKLRLAIHSLKTGKIVWEGIQTNVKL